MSILRQTAIRTRRTAFLMRHLALNVYVLDGEHNGAPLRALVADDGSTLPDVRAVIFPHGSELSKKGKISALSAPRLINSDADLVVIGANQLLLNRYAELGYYIVPKYVRLIMDLPDHPDALVTHLSDSVKDDVRKVRNRGFTYSVTHDQSWFDLFYHDMYRSYALWRFGEDADTCSYGLVKKAFAAGSGLAIKKDGEDVAGAVLLQNGPHAHMPFMGIRRGREHEAHQGSSAAIYYYSMALAHSWGSQSLGYGHSRPFLADGILRYKLKWGMRALDDDDGTAFFAITAPRRSGAALNYLSTRPFFHLQNGEATLVDGS